MSHCVKINIDWLNFISFDIMRKNMKKKIIAENIVIIYSWEGIATKWGAITTHNNNAICNFFNEYNNKIYIYIKCKSLFRLLYIYKEGGITTYFIFLKICNSYKIPFKNIKIDK